MSPYRGDTIVDARAFAALLPAIKPLIDKAQSAPMDEPEAHAGFVLMDGQIHAIALAAMTPEEPTEQQLKRRDRPMLVFTTVLDTETIAALGEYYLLEDLKLETATAAADRGSLRLEAPTGAILGNISWRKKTPGQAFLQRLVLPLVGSLIVVGVFVGLFIRHTQGVIALQAAEIVRRRRMAAHLETAKRTAETASSAKSDFLASMSHELRTPLNAIMGFAQVLELDPEIRSDPKKLQNLGYIVRSSRHLLDLINQVLDLARIEAGNSDNAPESVDLPALMDECLANARALAGDVGVDVANSVAICECKTMEVDPRRLKQVLLNLLSNAVKFNRPGGTVTLECRDHGNGRVRISVNDTGPGIPAASKDQIFQPFHRLARDEPTADGTGIGLSISKSLVTEMGGEMGLESELGIGTTFWIDLPIQASAPQSALQ